MKSTLRFICLMSIFGAILAESERITDPFQIRSTSSKRCFAIAGGENNLGGKLVTWVCDNMTRSQWRFLKPKPGDSGRQIEGVASSLCLAVVGASAAPGAKVVTWTCDNLPRSQWKILDPLPGSTGSQIQNVGSGLCLAITGASLYDGIDIVQWYCDNLGRSQWNPFVEPPLLQFSGFGYKGEESEPQERTTTPAYVS